MKGYGVSERKKRKRDATSLNDDTIDGRIGRKSDLRTSQGGQKKKRQGYKKPNYNHSEERKSIIGT